MLHTEDFIRTVGTLPCLNYAASDMEDAVAMLRKVHPNAYIDEVLVDTADAGELCPGFPRAFLVTLYLAEAEHRKSEGVVPLLFPLRYIVLARVDAAKGTAP